MPTTHHPNGVTNAALNSAFAQLMFPDPTLFHTYFNDFDTYTAGDWVVTETGAGGTQALTAGNGGLLLITSDALDNDGNVLQKTPAAFALAAGKKAWFSTRLAMEKATQSDMQVGLVIVDTTPLDATDGIYFEKLDGTATISIVSRKNATTGSTSAAVGTLVAATQTVLQWYYDGAGRLYFGQDGVQTGSLDVANYFPDATNLTVSIAAFNGEAGAATTTVDYVFAAVER
jgi:hypothetical protein